MAEREREFTLTDFFRLLKHRFPVIAACAIILAVFMTIAALASPPTYEARGILQISPEVGGFGFVGEYFNLAGSNQQVNTEIEIIRSRSISEVVIDELDLRLEIEDVTWPNPIIRAIHFIFTDKLIRSVRTLRVDDVEFTPESIDKEFILTYTDEAGNYRITGPEGSDLGSGHLGDLFTSGDLTLRVTAMTGTGGTKFRLTPHKTWGILKSFREDLSVIPLGGANRTDLIQVSWRSDNAMLTSDVVNFLIAEYERRNTEWKTSTGSTQTRELEARLAETTLDLNDAENALADYKNQYGVIVLPEEARLAVNEVSSREAEKVDINLKLSLLQSIHSNLFSQLHGENFLIPPALTSDPIIQQLAGDHARLVVEIQNLLLDYTELHPSVIVQKESLQSVRQNILDTLSATISGYIKQRNDIDAVIRTLDERMYSIPDVERDVLNLMRAVEVSEEAYRLLFRRLEEARLVETTLEIGNRIIDYAVPPAEPIAPSIKRNLIMGFGLGLVFGVFLIFLIEVFDPRLRRPEQIAGYVDGSPICSLAKGTQEEIATAASTLALAVIKCKTVQRTPSLSLLCPGPGSGTVRNQLERVISVLSIGINSILLVDTSVPDSESGFYKTPISPGISELSQKKEINLHSVKGGRIDILPAGESPSSAHVTNSDVAEFVKEKRDNSDLALYFVSNFASDPALRGWTGMSDGVVLILHRNRDLLADIFTTLEALEADKTPILATLIFD